MNDGSICRCSDVYCSDVSGRIGKCSDVSCSDIRVSELVLVDVVMFVAAM